MARRSGNDQEAENQAAANELAENRENERVNTGVEKRTGETHLLEESMRAAKMGGFAEGTSGAKGADYIPERMEDSAGRQVDPKIALINSVAATTLARNSDK